MIVEDTTAEERERGVKRVIVGNGKIVAGKSQTKRQEQRPAPRREEAAADRDDIPF